MPPRSRFVLTTLFLVLLSACTIQGLPYPTDTPDPNLITPDLQATREMAEAGMFPSSTPEPTKSPQTPFPTANETTLASTPAGSTFLVPSLTLKLAYIKEGNVWYWEEGQAALQLTIRVMQPGSLSTTLKWLMPRNRLRIEQLIRVFGFSDGGCRSVRKCRAWHG